MAIIHKAVLRPTKLELLSGWLPGQPWFTGSGVSEADKLGSFRFDDPAGEVGVETLLLADDGAVVQVPLTYRSAPLAGAEAALIGTLEHSVLGERWVYDGCGDPVYAATLAAVILAGRPQADMMVHADGKVERAEWTVQLETTAQLESTAPPETLQSGTPERVEAVTVDGVTTIKAGDVELRVVRRLGAAAPMSQTKALTGTWEAQPTPVLLAYAAG